MYTFVHLCTCVYVHLLQYININVVPGRAMLLEPTGRSHLCSTCRLRQAAALSVSAAARSLVQRVQSTVTRSGHLATAGYNAVRVASEKNLNGDSICSAFRATRCRRGRENLFSGPALTANEPMGKHSDS